MVTEGLGVVAWESRMMTAMVCQIQEKRNWELIRIYGILMGMVSMTWRNPILERMSARAIPVQTHCWLIQMGMV